MSVNFSHVCIIYIKIYEKISSGGLEVSLSIGYADWNYLPECLKAIEKASNIQGSPKIFKKQNYVSFCFTESMIHMHPFHPVLFGCDNQVGFLNV